MFGAVWTKGWRWERVGETRERPNMGGKQKEKGSKMLLRTLPWRPRTCDKLRREGSGEVVGTGDRALNAKRESGRKERGEAESHGQRAGVCESRSVWEPLCFMGAFWENKRWGLQLHFLLRWKVFNRNLYPLSWCLNTGFCFCFQPGNAGKTVPADFF